MAYYQLTESFNAFFKNLNPSPSFQEQASSQHTTIMGLLEDKNGLASALSPRCFLQGSYRQDTAIYTINDVDIVALCALWYPGSGTGRSWSRDEIFDTITAPLRVDSRYKDKIRYDQGSMCIKVDLGIKVEILPVVYSAGNYDDTVEPFKLFRPENKQWEDGYARYHQQRLSEKNSEAYGNFKPAIKVLKHLRSQFSLLAVSFHIECLLFSLPNYLFKGSPAEYIPSVLSHIASISATDWYGKIIRTPCGDRDIFTQAEWERSSWEAFHKVIVLWAKVAQAASQSVDRNAAIKLWQALLGEDFFPQQVGG